MCAGAVVDALSFEAFRPARGDRADWAPWERGPLGNVHSYAPIDMQSLYSVRRMYSSLELVRGLCSREAAEAVG